MQLQEAKIAMDESKNTHSHILQAFQQVESEKSKLNKESQLKIDEIQNKYKQELKDIEEEYQAQKQRL